MSVKVLDFASGEVRTVTPEQARAELDELCRSQGHYFASVWPVSPHPSDRCICGDIVFKEWQAANGEDAQATKGTGS